MRQRFDVNGEGLLADRHGYVLGRIVSMRFDDTGRPMSLTVEREGGAFKGGLGSAVPTEQQPPLTPPAGLEIEGLDIDIPIERRADSPPLLSEDGAIEAVWAHYVEVMAPRRKDLDPATRSLIRDALKIATLAECVQAIDGCRASAFHMGDNDRGKKYNRPSQILKGKRGIRTAREQIDLFLDIAEKHGGGASDSSVDSVRLRQAKQDVLTAWEFPRSEQAKKAGDMSAAWLAQHGYRVEPDAETGRPRFLREGE